MYISLFYYLLKKNSLIDFGVLRISFDEFKNLEYNLNILYES